MLLLMLRFELGRGNAHRARGVMERAIQALLPAPAALHVCAAAARALLLASCWAGGC